MLPPSLYYFVKKTKQNKTKQNKMEKAKHLDAGSPLEPLLPLSFRNDKEELG